MPSHPSLKAFKIPKLFKKLMPFIAKNNGNGYP